MKIKIADSYRSRYQGSELQGQAKKCFVTSSVRLKIGSMIKINQAKH